MEEHKIEQAPGQNGHKPEGYYLPQPTVARLKALYAQKQAIEQQMNNIMVTAVEVLGLTGSHNVDLDTGLLTPAQQPVALNRAQRRATAKK